MGVSFKQTIAKGYPYEKNNSFSARQLFSYYDEALPEAPPVDPLLNPNVNTHTTRKQLAKIKQRLLDPDVSGKYLLDKNRIKRLTAGLLNGESKPWKMSAISPVPVDSRDPLGMSDHMLHASFYFQIMEGEPQSSWWIDDQRGNLSTNQPISPMVAAAAAKAELLLNAGEFTVDFAAGYKLNDTAAPRWVYGRTNREGLADSNPAFYAAGCLSKNINSYQYLKTYGFSQAEKTKLETWIFNAAVYFKQRNADASILDAYPNRYVRDYSRKGRFDLGHAASAMYSWFNPATNQNEQVRCTRNWKFFNNRRADMYAAIDTAGHVVEIENIDLSKVGRFVNGVGESPSVVTYYLPNRSQVETEIELMKLAGKLFYEECHRFAFNGRGDCQELERGGETEPQKGIQYAKVLIAHLNTICYNHLLAGDSDLKNYKTRFGDYGSACIAGEPDKTMSLFMHRIGKMLDGRASLYATIDETKIGNPFFLIDGKADPGHPDGTKYYAFDSWFHQANIGLKDSYIKALANRTAPGCWQVPDGGYGQNHGSYGAYGTGFAIYPAHWTQFANMENENIL